MIRTIATVIIAGFVVMQSVTPVIDPDHVMPSSWFTPAPASTQKRADDEAYRQYICSLQHGKVFDAGCPNPR